MVVRESEPSTEAPSGTEEGLHGRDPKLNLPHFRDTDHTDNDLMVVLAEALDSCGDHVEAPQEGRRGGGGGPEEEGEEDGAGRELHLGGGLPPLRVKEFSCLEVRPVGIVRHSAVSNRDDVRDVGCAVQLPGNKGWMHRL